MFLAGVKLMKVYLDSHTLWDSQNCPCKRSIYFTVDFKINFPKQFIRLIFRYFFLNNNTLNAEEK